MRFVSCLLAGLLLSGAAASDAAVLYSVTELLTPPGTTSRGSDINNLGQVVGSYTVGFVAHSFLYSNAQVVDLGLPPGSDARSINDAGQITGAVSSAPGSSGFLYANGQLTLLGTLPGFTGSVGLSINNAGQIAG